MINSTDANVGRKKKIGRVRNGNIHIQGEVRNKIYDRQQKGEESEGAQQQDSNSREKNP